MTAICEITSVEAISEFFNLDKEPIELLKCEGSEWLAVLIIPSAKCPGYTQVQYFSPNGFYRDIQYADLFDAINNCLEQGYDYPVKGQLSKVFWSRRFVVPRSYDL